MDNFKVDKIKIIGSCIIIVILLGIIGFSHINKNREIGSEYITPTKYNDEDFNLRLIKTVNSSYKSGYLISPYSIETVLNMLKEGANGNTLEEINNVLGGKILNKSLNDVVESYNACFIKKDYQNNVNKVFIDILKSDYNANILYDTFKSSKIINDWVNDKTKGEIKNIVDNVDDNFVLAIVNAILIDQKWDKKFLCDDTLKGVFTKIDNTKMDVEMMHNTYDSNLYYFKTDNGNGVILPYEEKNGKNLEFVGILPNDGIINYIDKLDKDELKNIDNSKMEAKEDFVVSLSLPRFKYDFNLQNFKDILIKMGINDVFSTRASFSNIISNSSIPIYVSDAIHKTSIDLNEEGTKASSVTSVIMEKFAIEDVNDQNGIKISFNKPFVYMIRDKESKEILFFGTVMEPNKWHGSTCKQK